MVAGISSNTFGVLWVFGLALILWAGNDAKRLIVTRKAPTFRVELQRSLRDLGLTIMAFCGLWLVFVVRTLAYDHNGLTYVHQKDVQLIGQLQSELQYRRHNLAITDPVFSNITSLMNAFRVYKSNLHGETCLLKITAPASTEALAMTFSQFSIATSNCPTYGPMVMFANTNPEILPETMDGILPDAIIFHAPKDDAAANELFGELGNQIKLVRSYEMPKTVSGVPSKIYLHNVWLQFGTDVKWNTEMR